MDKKQSVQIWSKEGVIICDRVTPSVAGGLDMWIGDNCIGWIYSKTTFHIDTYDDGEVVVIEQ